MPENVENFELLSLSMDGLDVNLVSGSISVTTKMMRSALGSVPVTYTEGLKAWDG